MARADKPRSERNTLADMNRGVVALDTGMGSFDSARAFRVPSWGVFCLRLRGKMACSADPAFGGSVEFEKCRYWNVYSLFYTKHLTTFFDNFDAQTVAAFELLAENMETLVLTAST